ncbi:MAG: hypothetical protein FWE16_05400 [Firmicutes bacterium]|nr:hypothetical protein [Bacillota bacterium]
MKITPLFDRVLLAPVKNESQQNGIYIPKSDTDKIQIFDVMAVGKGCTTIKRWDKIIISRFTISQMPVSKDKLFLAKEIDIMATVEG